jgi:hypothetical protein
MHYNFLLNEIPLINTQQDKVNFDSTHNQADSLYDNEK